MHIWHCRDKTGRLIHLTRERYAHIVKHPEIQQPLLLIERALATPLLIANHPFDPTVHDYYRYEKQLDPEARYLKVIVKYLNGTGFIITAYPVQHLP